MTLIERLKRLGVYFYLGSDEDQRTVTEAATALETMLEALERIVEECERDCPYNAQDIARAAIAKVKGQ